MFPVGPWDYKMHLTRDNNNPGSQITAVTLEPGHTCSSSTPPRIKKKKN